MRVAVIGAGAAGLAACRELSEAGLQVVVFEQAAAAGGTWVYEERVETDPLGNAPGERIHGSMYASLRTNLPRELMSFRGVPFEAPSRFPGHEEVAAYLQAFAAPLLPMIRFGNTVERLEPLRADGSTWSFRIGSVPDTVSAWRIVVRHPSGVLDERFDAVAVCNGHYSVPSVPPLPGLDTFSAAVLHSHNYRRPEPFADQRIVLLGAKASGVDLSRDLSGHATRVFLCAREHESVSPDGLRGNVERRPAIANLNGRTVELEDGTRIDDVDTLIFCTGYQFAFPFLNPATGVVDIVDRNVQPLWLSMLAARCPTAAFIGLPFLVVPFPLVERQAAFFGATLTGRAAVPPWADRLAAVEARERELIARGVARRHILRLGADQNAYEADLERRCGYEPKPAWFSALRDAVSEHRQRYPNDFRDRPLPFET